MRIALRTIFGPVLLAASLLTLATHAFAFNAGDGWGKCQDEYRARGQADFARSISLENFGIIHQASGLQVEVRRSSRIAFGFAEPLVIDDQPNLLWYYAVALLEHDEDLGAFAVAQGGSYFLVFPLETLQSNGIYEWIRMIP